MEHLSESNHELADQYEKLRANALDKFQVTSNRLPGFSILLLRGTASWITACLCSELSQVGSSSSRKVNHQTMESILPSVSVQKEAIKILTHMILSYSKELRSHYA